MIIRKFNIAIVDRSIVQYWGDSVDKVFLPAAQTSIINISEALFDLGFFVTVFCSGSKKGIHNFVNYRPMSELSDQTWNFDIIISVDSLEPFDPNGNELYNQLRRDDQLKILWVHSSNFEKHELLEKLVVTNSVNQIFTTGDRNTNELINGLGSIRRMFEVLKHKIFQTRYGVKISDNTDPLIFSTPGTLKERHSRLLFNTPNHKAADLLVSEIWPKLRAVNQNLELAFAVNLDDEIFRKMYETYNQRDGIVFLPNGYHVSKISYYEQCLLNLCPVTDNIINPIDLLESVACNVPVVGFRTSSFNESLGDNSYFVVETSDGVEGFVQQTLKYLQDRILQQQYLYGCNLSKEILSWKDIALQWKQQIYYYYGSILEHNEQEKVQWINHRVNAITQKTHINPAEVTIPAPPKAVTAINYYPLSVAIIDIVGASYDGNTLRNRGLGGSESAVISIARELVVLGFRVTVFNGCNEDNNSPGTYDGVEYLPITLISEQSAVYDIVISLRTPEIFADHRQSHIDFKNPRQLPWDNYEMLRQAKFRILWMHDTFSNGDNVIQSMVLNNQIDEVWVLSDFHKNYFLNCDHGQKRNYELLRDRVWCTRNGINKYIDTVDFSNKDPNLFVFNANLTKGLRPLLQRIWPAVKQRIPSAKLSVIGGYYQLGALFSSNFEIDEFEKLIGQYRNQLDIEFTGIVDQKTVAEIMHKATYFIYPCDLPETFSISAWESLSVGTPLITCRFGALEETAIDGASWKINYPVYGNSLFPNIPVDQQVDYFVDTVVTAYNNPNELEVRRANCLLIQDIAEWKTVALEWKHRFYQRFHRFMSSSENQQVQYTTAKYSALTGRRSASYRYQLMPTEFTSNKLIIISTFRNSDTRNCIYSIAAQQYSNYHHYVVNDFSDDSSPYLLDMAISNIPEDQKNKITIIHRDQSHGAVYNQVDIIRQQENNAVILLIDGDDFLSNRPDIFNLYNHLYNDSTEFTYGSMFSQADRIPLVAQPYDVFTRQNKNFRKVMFSWIIPYTHIRTFRKYLINNIPDSEFKDNKNRWFKAGGDVAVFYNLIEKANPDSIVTVNDIVYQYNDNLTNNDFRINSDEQQLNARMILSGAHRIKVKKRLLIAIPTARYIEPSTFKSIYDQEVPEDFEVTFQYFFGYNVDQVRNLIADWAVKGYDYLWAIDSDISFPPNTLINLLSHDCDIVSAVYRQRIPGNKIVELFRSNLQGGVSNIDWAELEGRGLVEVDACGFGCVLIKTEVLSTVGYPQFCYHSALNHEFTISEDIDFCKKAKEKGYKIYADTRILCDHTGSIIFGMNQ